MRLGVLSASKFDVGQAEVRHFMTAVNDVDGEQCLRSMITQHQYLGYRQFTDECGQETGDWRLELQQRAQGEDGADPLPGSAALEARGTSIIHHGSTSSNTTQQMTRKFSTGPCKHVQLQRYVSIALPSMPYARGQFSNPPG
jgi:hypothetical protein